MDLQNQTVLLEDGEVSVLGADPTLSWLREAPHPHPGGCGCWWGRTRPVSRAERVICGPYVVPGGQQMPHKQRPDHSGHKSVVALLLSLSCTPRTVFSLPESHFVPTMTVRAVV